MSMSEYLRRPDAQGYLKVLEVLREWDPIGVIFDASDIKQDEYDSYAPEIVYALDAGVKVEDLVSHMARIVRERMELQPDFAKTYACAQKLVDFWQEWEKTGRGRRKSS